MLSRLGLIYNNARQFKPNTTSQIVARSSISNKHGVLHQVPHRTSLGILKVLVTVTTGLLIGAAISKNIANFLEENDLFVPSDDDDDDD
ncbi:unnamed protein product [Phyllotreta striolata]|uniref:Essential MCU regulator, mitochondrial n=1 Tax=Phyllotreta striolata TaxID=444603 RepID=A0A9N9XT75_PHYSR|nr:unnamed protein product [Phyllotreta striolata]